MINTSRKKSRRQHILQCLARMLEDSPGERITTAGLAKQVGVSEAALYRHFPSKAKMFEGLIAFIEDTIFSRVHRVMAEEPSSMKRCETIVLLLLQFAERNPGITRLLTGDVLAGETEVLRKRIAQFYERVETQLKQILREAELREGLQPAVPVSVSANMMMAFVEGRMGQFVRSEFQRKPTDNCQMQWALVSANMFTSQVNDAAQTSAPSTETPPQAQTA